MKRPFFTDTDFISIIKKAYLILPIGILGFLLSSCGDSASTSTEDHSATETPEQFQDVYNGIRGKYFTSTESKLYVFLNNGEGKLIADAKVELLFNNDSMVYFHINFGRFNRPSVYRIKEVTKEEDSGFSNDPTHYIIEFYSEDQDLVQLKFQKNFDWNSENAMEGNYISISAPFLDYNTFEQMQQDMASSGIDAFAPDAEARFIQFAKSYVNRRQIQCGTSVKISEDTPPEVDWNNPIPFIKVGMDSISAHDSISDVAILKVSDSILDNDSKMPFTTIGEDQWATENLNVDHFRNGEIIPEAKSIDEFKIACFEKKPIWCYPDFNPENGKIYGKLYNWYAVADKRGLAPNFWYIPEKEAWDNLIKFTLGQFDEFKNNKTGLYLKGLTIWRELESNKEEYFKKWTINNKNFEARYDPAYKKGISFDDYFRASMLPRDKFLFNALPSGCIISRGSMGDDFIGKFKQIGTAAYWWSFTECSLNRTATGIEVEPDTENAYIYKINSDYDFVLHYNNCGSWHDGYSVRCWRPDM